MHYRKSSNRLTVELDRDFNLNVVREMEKISVDKQEIYIDLGRSRFVDTEAIIFLHKLIQQEKRVRLKNPPKLFFEAIQILGFHEVWDLKTLVER